MGKLALKNLTKSYGNMDILKEINLDVNSGEFLVLVGPSGCGKSTTLRLISGLEETTSGEIYIDDVLVNNMDPSKRDISMVFQNYALYPQMTVRENMAFGLKIRKFSLDEINQRVTEASEILQIRDLLDRKPKQLSGGQRQRVALGRAIVRKPKIFLFDEPLSNLDAKLRQEMRIEIKKLHQLLDTTMIYVTHDQVEAMTMGDRIAVMNNGIIEQIDSPDQIYKNPVNVFTSSFIGSPRINLIKGKLKLENQKWFFQTKDQIINIDKSHYQYDRLKEGKAIFGVRSEDIYLKSNNGEMNLKEIIKSRVKFIEYLGSDMNVYCDSNDITFTLRIDKNETNNIKIGDSILTCFDINQAHFFDIDNGNVI